MSKRYLKKVTGSEDLVIVKNKPIWGKIPFKYRGVDWNIDDVWHSSIGEDLLNSTDPFGDGSLMHKWRLNGDLIDLVTGNEATAVGTLTWSDGVFDSKCYATLDPAQGGSYIDCGTIARDGKTEICISGWIKNNDHSGLDANHTSHSVWHLTPDDDNNSGSSRQPDLEVVSNNGIFSVSNDSNTGKLSKNFSTNNSFLNNKWIHIIQQINDNVMEIYVNGILVGKVSTSDTFLHNDGKFYIHDKWYIAGSFIQQVEMYNRMLTEHEIRELYNQQRLVIQKHDGSNANYPTFTYLEEDNKLIELTVSDDGVLDNKKALVEKPGYIYGDDNLVKVDENELIDRYGNKLNKVINETRFLCTVGPKNHVQFNNADWHLIPFDYIIDKSSMFDDYLTVVDVDASRLSSVDGGGCIQIKKAGYYNIYFKVLSASSSDGAYIYQILEKLKPNNDKYCICKTNSNNNSKSWKNYSEQSTVWLDAGDIVFLRGYVGGGDTRYQAHYLNTSKYTHIDFTYISGVK